MVMLIGNKDAQEMLKKYVQKTVDGEVKSSFLLAIGPKNLGKSSLVLDMLKDTVGDFFRTDVLYIRDCSEFLGKKHTLKVELPTDNKKQFITVENDDLYQDLGTREMNKWLQRSPVGKIKVLFVENIERMNIAAANAFLKTAEEPLDRRIIIATTSNASALLDTILSRAIQIKFQPVAYDELLNYAVENSFFGGNRELQEFVCLMVMGKPGLLHRYQDILENNTELKGSFLKTIHALLNKQNILDSYKMLLSLKDYGVLEAFLDGVIAFSQENQNFVSAERWLTVRKMLNSNVNIDNLMLYGLC